MPETVLGKVRQDLADEASRIYPELQEAIIVRDLAIRKVEAMRAEYDEILAAKLALWLK
jgi:hypothetical protein